MLLRQDSTVDFQKTKEPRRHFLLGSFACEVKAQASSDQALWAPLALAADISADQTHTFDSGKEDPFPAFSYDRIRTHPVPRSGLTIRRLRSRG